MCAGQRTDDIRPCECMNICSIVGQGLAPAEYLPLRICKCMQSRRGGACSCRNTLNGRCGESTTVKNKNFQKTVDKGENV